LIDFGFDLDLDDAAKQALRTMIDRIVDQAGIDRNDAYALSSCPLICALRKWSMAYLACMP